MNVLITVSDGWAYRNLFCTDFYQTLAKNNVVTIIASDYFYDLLCQRDQGLKVIKFKKSNKFILSLISLSNYIYRAKNNFRISVNYFSRLSFIQKLFYYISYPFFRLFGTILLKSIDVILNFIISKSYNQNEDTQSFDKILFFSPYAYDEIVYSYWFKKHKSKKIYVLPSWDNIYKYNTIDNYDSYVVWGNEQKKFLISQEISQEKIKSLGSISQYVFNILKSNYGKTGCKHKIRLLYGTVTERLFKNEYQFVKEFKEKLESGYFGLDIDLFIRLHPADNNLDLYLQLQSNCVKVVNTSVTSNLYNWNVDSDFFQNQSRDLMESDIVINVASTITLDSIMLNKFTINLKPAFCFGKKNYYEFEHYRSITRSKAIPLINDFECLKKVITEFRDGKIRFDEKMKNSIGSVIYLHNSKNLEEYINQLLGL